MDQMEQDWEAFKQKFNAKAGIDLNYYKRAQMQRRITNLMTRHGHSSYTAFFSQLEKDPKAYKEFVEYITINVTEFFRTPEKFEELEKKVLADLLQRSPKLNIWSAGCSMGAEPYSLSMILADLTPNARHRILATDLDEEVLGKAREGKFSANEYKNISTHRASKYFTK